MSEDVLYGLGTIEITPRVVRLDQVSYQMANIESVSITSRRSINSAAMLLFLIGVPGLLLLAYAIKDGVDKDYAPYVALAAAVAAIGALLIQNYWPVVTFTLSLRTSSGDVKAITSRDEGHVGAIKSTIEQAFAWSP